MKFIIVRHGGTIDNVNDISMGWKDSSLTERGIKQSNSIRKKLNGEKVDYVYSSDLGRSIETAKIIIGRRIVRLVRKKELREQCRGDYEKKPRKIMYNSVKGPYHKWKPKNGESLIDVWNRVTPFIEKLKKKKGSILIVGHRRVNACIIAYLNGKKVEDFEQYMQKGHNKVIEIQMT